MSLLDLVLEERAPLSYLALPAAAQEHLTDLSWYCGVLTSTMAEAIEMINRGEAEEAAQVMLGCLDALQQVTKAH